MTRLSSLKPLFGEQLQASDPRAQVWLSASAGTGKTHVLSARVLRLLLSGVDPASILCLTFTKAGAAEMADRVQQRLADWVRRSGADLARDLKALGEDYGPAAVARARTLFARVLDAPGGLRIQTIHAFCQTLLAGFPSEAGLAPGFRPLEDREAATLARATLAELLVEAESGGELGLIRDVQALSRRLGEEAAQRFLMACARAPDAMAALGQGIEAQLRRTLGVPDGDVEAELARRCHDDSFDCASLGRIAEANAAWATERGLRRAGTIARWLAGSPEERAVTLGELGAIWSIAKGHAPQDEDYADHAGRLGEACRALLELRTKAELARLLAAGLRAGQAYARAYREAKRAAGWVDFDDLIRHAVALLETDGMGDWVRYKLDQATDHVLVDEGQDTNAQQWRIVAALAGEFFAGEGARAGVHRTIFSVGDFKQAIFGFQGTDPQAFRAARRYFSALAEGAGTELLHLSLDRSFRSSPPILTLVDRLLADLGGERFGIDDETPPHATALGHLPGTVTLWRPHSTIGSDDEDAGEESWIDDATRGFATRLARQVRQWLDQRPFMASRGRALRPEDILILVRKRGALASLIVARLHAEDVPVAGVDRLRLDAPLAVRDLLAAVRFVLQPEDDLNLAGLLVSPLFGLDQDRLFAVGYGRKSSLWSALRDDAASSAEVEALSALLAAADFTTPHRFLEEMLSGPLDGRRKLLRRLGAEARDPIDELLAAALRFEADAAPSLQTFLDWFDRGEVDIKRDPSAPLDAVRVMTVHGAKGLQAPLVILADATGDPAAARRGTLSWEPGDGRPPVPLFRPRKEERFAPFDQALEIAERREREEHWRLLYVALTRAEERLVIGGALGARAKGIPPAESWYQAVDAALAALGAEWSADELWGGARHLVGEGSGLAPARRESARVAPAAAPEPAWLRQAAPAEARPPRPLAPSSLGRDLVAEPPPSPAMAQAARRGRLLHGLFERLPAIPPERRAAAADRWLERSGGEGDPAVRAALVRDACAIIGDPAFADVFAPEGLAEAPIAAVVAGEVIAGTVDRLHVGETLVRVVDFKTGRRVPAGQAEVPEHHLRQMAAYAAALAVIFPGRQIEAGLLYTAGPRLIALDPAVLDAHKPGFAQREQSLGAGR